MKKIRLVLACGLFCFSTAVIPVQADDTSDVVFHITYLGVQSTDPVYVLEDAENYSTYKSYTPMEASYVLTDPSTGSEIQSGQLVDGELSVSGTVTFYTLTIKDQTVGSTVHIAEQSGMVISNGTASASDGATFTVGSNPQANDFAITVGNARTVEEVGTPSAEAEISEEVEQPVPSPIPSPSPSALIEQSHDCSSYGTDYYWDSIRGSCMVQASAAPTASADVEAEVPSTRTPAVIAGSAAGIFLLLWAVWMLRKYGSRKKK